MGVEGGFHSQIPSRYVGSMEKSDLYKAIIEKLPLLDKDRESLKKKRGFTDEVIDKMLFRSCGPFIKKDPFFDGVPDKVSYALSQENIVIPYFGPGGDIFYIRPHKFGIADESIQIYVPWALLDSSEELLIAESEFKAVASCMMGVPAIGIPGIASFSKGKLPVMIDLLRSVKCKKAIVCFDNEVKDKPDLPNYKPDYTKRYDTMIYEYVMANSLNKADINARIARLQDVWRVDGKADIDGVLAAGIPAAQFKKCISESITPSEYRYSWKLPPAHRSFVERKLNRWFYDGPVSIQHDCYFLSRGRDIPTKVTNFVIEIIHTLHSDRGMERYCRFVSSYGTSKAIIVTPEAMASKTAFQKFCYEQGDFEFNGRDSDLQNIWNYVFMSQDGKTIRKLKFHGYDEETKIWFFENGAYAEGDFHKASEDGIVWIGDQGFRLFDPTSDISVPKLVQTDVDFTLFDIYDNLSAILGKDYAKLMLGWTLGNFFMDEIVSEYKSYPFLFLYGRMAQGKSTLANWCSSFFGFTQKGVPFSSSSPVGMSRITSQMSMIPVWLEEYRNKDDAYGKKNNFLRSIYDKSVIVKGTKNPDEIKTYKARSTLIISGEERPNDAALNSRCLFIPIYRDDKDTTEQYNWLQAHMSQFSAIGHQCLVNKKELWPGIKAKIEEYMKSFAEDMKGIGSRNRLQTSVIAGVCDAIIGEHEGFSYFVGQEAEQSEVGRDHEQALYVFLDDIVNLNGTGKITFPFIEIKKIQKSGVDFEVCYFWFGGVYS